MDDRRGVRPRQSRRESAPAAAPADAEESVEVVSNLSNRATIGIMTSHDLSAKTVLPPDDMEALLDFSRLVDQIDEPAALVGPDGQTVPLPLPLFEVLVDAAHALKEGLAITIAPLDRLMTTQEAADFLGISRPTLIKLLDSREIPHERPGAGRHRRIRLQDVLAYKERNQERRRTLLEGMTREASSAGLYESDADSYREALRRARKQSPGS